jgi:hypothetical protein
MTTLNAPLKALADFLYVSADLIQVAAVRSQPMDQKATRRRLERWVATLPDSEKTALLCRLVAEEGRSVRAEMLQRFSNANRVSHPASADSPRTVGALLGEVEGRARQAMSRVGKRKR